MLELSLHILDVCENSLKANSSLIELIINEQPKSNILEISIIDDGFGMDAETLKKVTNPFFTTRTTRDVGLGVSLFKMAAEMAEGSFTIDSVKDKGTVVKAIFQYDHIDRAPLGNMSETLSILALNQGNVDIYYKHTFNEKTYIFDTKEIKQVLDGIPFTNHDVIMWIKNNINEGILDIHKEESQ